MSCITAATVLQSTVYCILAAQRFQMDRSSKLKQQKLLRDFLTPPPTKKNQTQAIPPTPAPPAATFQTEPPQKKQRVNNNTPKPKPTQLKHMLQRFPSAREQELRH